MNQHFTINPSWYAKHLLGVGKHTNKHCPHCLSQQESFPSPTKIKPFKMVSQYLPARDINHLVTEAPFIIN